jgi:hypothetical protein
MGGLLTLNSFITQFPELDTSSASYQAMKKPQQIVRSDVQGPFAFPVELETS